MLIESVNGGANLDPGAHSTSATDSFVGTKLLRLAASNSNRAPAEITCNFAKRVQTKTVSPRTTQRSRKRPAGERSTASRTPRLAAVRANKIY